MPCLYCEKHGKEHEARTKGRQEEYRQEGDCVLIVSGTLASGPWRCDSCNARLGEGDRAWLVSSFPSHYRDDLHGYDFGYERQYFAMTATDQATAYGAQWPDNSIRKRRITGGKQISQGKEPPCALDLSKPKPTG